MATPLDLAAHPVIAAVRDLDHVEIAASSPVRVVFLMTGDALSVGPAIARLHAARKQVVVHIDLVKGVAADKAGVEFLAASAGPDAIVSTKLHVLQAARKAGLQTVLHLFVIDTQAYHTGLKHVHDIDPDAIELMPGLMPRVISDLRQAVAPPIVAAGLIRTFAEVEQAIASGAVATVVGATALWQYELT